VWRILIVVAACSTPPAPVTGHATTHGKRELAGYPSVVEPAEAAVACALDGEWAYGQPDELRFRDGGPVFATVISAKTAHLELAGASAFVELDAKALRLWGYVDRGALTLHAARAFLLADYLIPGPYAALRSIDAKPRAISVELVLPKYVKPITAARGVQACSDLSLAEVTFTPRAAVGDDRETDDALAAGVAIPLSTKAGGQPVAELRFDHEAPVDVLERQGNVARVVLDTYSAPEADTYVVGWVPQAMLRPGPSGYGIDGSRGGGRGGLRGRPRGNHHVRCTHPVPLVVELAGERHLVGEIAPGVVISELGETADTVEVALDRVGLALVPGARSLVKREALHDCEAATP
jgi:hypothetical protein